MNSTDELEAQSVAAVRAVWPVWKRVAFRFAFTFWVLFDNGLWLVLWVWPWLKRHVSHWLDMPLEKLTLWAGTHIFHLSGEAAARHPTGSGDTALGWVGAFCTLVVALLVCAVWSGISEARGRRREYNTLYAWLRLVLRFVLAMTLFSYGFEKVFPLQMPPPSATTLAETYGASSPMRLAWTFIGASWLYRIFAGLSEVIPGVLLCFRRTSTLGALGAAAVMLNVFMMNLGYDIPVKLYSFELLLMSLFLLLPDATPMWQFFVRRRDAVLTGVWVRKPERKALRIAAHCLQVLVIGYILNMTAMESWRQWHGSKTPMAGSWQIDEADGAMAGEHWAFINFRGATYAQFKVASSDKPGIVNVKISSEKKMVELLNEDADGNPAGAPYATLHWTEASAGHMVLAGTWKGAATSLKMHRVDPPPTLLMTRGFRWVQEYPLNR